jgi:hypothetical protein
LGGGGGCLRCWAGLETSRIGITRDIVCPWGAFISTTFLLSFPSPPSKIDVTSHPQDVLEIGCEPWNAKPYPSSLQRATAFLCTEQVCLWYGEK